jgi:serine/threonine-protein kinase RsbW
MTIKVFDHEKIVSKGIISELRQICSRILCRANVLGYSKDDQFAIHLALEEAVVNAVRHGNKQDTEKDIVIEYDLSPEKIELWVTDQGGGFKPGDVADPRSGENIYKAGGRGVLLIKSYMNSVEYNKTGNSVHMTKLNSKPA